MSCTKKNQVTLPDETEEHGWVTLPAMRSVSAQNEMPGGYDAAPGGDFPFKDLEASVPKVGFIRGNMKPTDDCCCVSSHGEVVGDDGHVGFVERNNYMDSL